MDRIKNIAIVLLTILVVGLSFFLCVNFHTNNQETKTAKTDTLYLLDTIEIQVKKDSIVYRDKKVVDTLYLPTPQDTTPITIEQKHYKDTLADIWVSGYEPTIDSIHYHVPHNTTYVEKTFEVEKQKKWYEDRFCITFGVYGGYGLIHKQPDIFIGAGVGIRLGK